jgi:membrane protein implicated in regulation of membrane protease activity
MYFQLEHWHWWVLTLIFVVGAAVMRNPIHLTLTAATSIVGLVAWLDPSVPAKAQLLLFGLAVGIGLVIPQFLVKDSGKDSKKTFTDPNFVDHNDSPADLVVGRTFTLDAPIVNGSGTISFDDRTWKLRGEDTDAGTKIRIESVDGIDSTFLEVSIVK